MAPFKEGAIGVALFVIVIIALVIVTVRVPRLMYFLEKRSLEGLEAQLNSMLDLLPAFLKSSVKSSIQKHRIITQMAPQPFYYLDQTQIDDIHSQFVMERQPLSMETEEQGLNSVGLTARLRSFGPEFKRTRGVKTIKKYDTQLALSSRYRQVEQHLFSNPSEVTFGLEDFKVSASRIEEFEAMVKHMDEEFNFTIPQELQDRYLRSEQSREAESHLARLKDASGYVACQAECIVGKSIDGRIVLALDHPVNEYLDAVISRVEIEIVCNVEALTPAGKAVFREGTTLKITCLGRAISWDDGKKALILSAIAIY